MTSTDAWEAYLEDVAPDLDAQKWIRDPTSFFIPSAELKGIPGIAGCIELHNKKIQESSIC